NGPYTARLLDPTTGSESTVSMSDDLWCGGAAQLPNGNILFVGGTKLYDIDVNNCNGQWHGGNAAYEFDVPSGTLIKQTSMAHGRWYPTLVTLPNGNVIVVSGADEYGTYNYLAEVYNSSSKSWTIQYDPTSNNTYCVGAGQDVACPGAGSPCYGGPNQGTTPWLSLYPRMNLMPSGLVFQSGQIQATNIWDPSAGAWTTVNTTSQYRDYGTGILLPLQNTTTENGKVMIVGGSVAFDTAATNVVEIEDFNQGTSRAPVLRTGPSLNNGRKFVLPIILPNGKVVVFGGTSQGTTNYVFVPESFDPENEGQGWAILPAATVGRTYHGTALLLPDGSVWTASSTPNPCTADENRTEIFKPDYFSATRPTISGTPSVGGYGQSITIPTPNPSSISRVSLVRLGATTHHFDTNVRLIWLQITGTGSNSVTVSAPLNANLAPPGYYMIHVLDASRVPSIAQIIQIPGTGSGVSNPPAQVTGVAVATAGSTQLNLSWTANTEPDLNHYNIYRSTTYGFTVNTATDTPIASPTTNSYSNTGLTASTTYYYKVAAVNNSSLIGPVSTQAFGDTAPTTTTGQHAVVLDGVVQYINGGTGPTLQVGETAGSEASYSMWIKYHQVSSNPGVFMRRGPTGSFVPYLGSNGVLGCDVHYNTQTADFFNGGALSTDTWHHVVITHSNVTNTTVLYLDGVSVASSAKADFLLNTGPNRLLMGATVLTDTTQTNFFPGLVDDARVYSIALSSSEVSTLFAGNNITRGLVSRWTFDEGTGTIANDSVGTNTATLSPADGAPPWTSDVPAALSSGGGGTGPAQVTGVAVVTAGSTQLNLSWTANTEPDLNHYNIYRSTTYGFTVNTATDTPI
ncbi:MAG: DUF1929 domain-containing protein, partial [Thermoproteota archaeon]|nr:DUF1929 domain-containing protein [Thermoproteota archaeon]